jgi:type I restriction enzyme S subunit
MNWTEVSLRRVARFIYGDALSSEVREEGTVPVVGSGGVSGLHTRANAPGPAIVVGRKGSYGAIHWLDRDCFVIDTAYSVEPVDRETNKRWLYYALQAADIKGPSQDVGVPGLSREAAYSVPISLTPFDEQRRIADFLDAETGRIDQLMANQLQLLELLEERANSRILDLIGQSIIVSPEGAAVVPLRRVITKLNRPVRPTDEVITAFRDGQVTARSRRRSEGYTISANSEPQGQGVDVGDIVIHGLDGFAGAIGDSESSGNCTPVYHVCHPIDGGNSAFYGRLLRLLALGDYLALFGASARERAVDFRNWKIFGHAPVPFIPQDKQHEIGGSITKIRPLREEVKRFNERLAERRQALITAAVTGEIDVTTAGGAAEAVTG